MLNDNSGLVKWILSILLFPTLFQEAFVLFAWGASDTFWVMMSKRIFLLLPVMAIILGCWFTAACTLTAVFRPNRQAFVMEIIPLEEIDAPEETITKIMEPLKKEVRRQGLWAAHLPPDLGGGGFGQVKLGLMHEILGQTPRAPVIFGNNAPDSGNAELLALGGTEDQKKRFMAPLLAGVDGGSGAPIFNIVLDHLTMKSSGDGNVDIYGDVHDVTLSNSLIWNSIQGQHFSRSSGERDAITVYRNVYAKNNEGQPRIRYNTTRLEFVNNVIYGWGWFEGGASGMTVKVGGSQYSPSANIENNIYHYVSGLHGNPDNALIIDGEPFGDWFFAGNDWPSGENDDVSTSGRIAIPTAAQVERLSTIALGDSVVPCAGTHFANAEERELLNTISLAVGGTAAECVSKPSGPRPKPPTNLQSN